MSGLPACVQWCTAMTQHWIVLVVYVVFGTAMSQACTVDADQKVDALAKAL